MKRKMWWIVLTLVMTLVVSGCGQSKPSTPAQQPSGDKELVVAIPKVTQSFDFYNTTNGFESVSMAQVYDTLVVKDSAGKTVPSLAEKFEVTPDGKVYTFTLRKGVKFSNGIEFKAKDAKYSLEQAMASSYTSWAYAPVNDIQAVDDYTVKINMKSPSVGFLEYLANNNYCAMLSEETVKKFGKDYGKTVESSIGTGPYILKEWKPGELCVYEANPNYFKGAPTIKKVRMKTITDANAAIIALQTGEIKAYFNDIPGINYESVAKSDKLNMDTFASTIFFEVIMNTKTGPFADVRLRQAVAYAVDRQQMLTVGVEGHGALADYPGNRQGYTEGDPALKNSWYATDLEKAKQLIKDANMEGKSITIKTYATDPYPKLATVLQDALTKIGLKVQVQQMERSAFIDEVTKKGQFEIGICRWAAGTKDMDEIMFGSLATASIGSPGNWSWYSNATVDELLNKAQASTQPDARKQLYADVIKIYAKDVPQIPLYYPNGSRAYSKELVIDKGNVEYDRFADYKWK